jgi:hypothetical protein
MDREGGKDTKTNQTLSPKIVFHMHKFGTRPFKLSLQLFTNPDVRRTPKQFIVHYIPASHTPPPSDLSRAWIYRGTGYRLPISTPVFIPAEPFRFVRGAGNSKSGFPDKKFIWSFRGVRFRRAYPSPYGPPDCGGGCHRGLTPRCETEVKWLDVLAAGLRGPSSTSLPSELYE